MTRIRVDRIAFEGARREKDSRFADCLEIRRIVFLVGQGIAAEFEFDGLDAEAEHFLATQTDSGVRSPVGVARMRVVDQNAKAERVGVLESARDRGIGREIMNAIEARARELDVEAIVLHAQLAVLPFYEKLGYEVHGEVFDEAGIEHRSMRKTLRPLESKRESEA